MSRFVQARFLQFWVVILTGALATAPAGAADGPLVSASRQFDAGNYAQAVAILRSAVQQNAQGASLHFWLARSYYELHDFDNAIASAERAVKLAPTSSEYHDWLGRAYGGKAEHAGWFSGLSLAKKVRRAFEHAVELDPSNFSAQRDLIEFYLEAPGIAGGGEEKALQQIEALAALDPGEARVARGAYWLKRKKPEQAEAEFQQALKAKLKRVDPYLEVADYYLDRTDAAHVTEAIEAAARVGPSDRRLSYYRGAALLIAGQRLTEAERLLTTYLSTVPERSDYPSHASAHEWLGRLYEREGRRDAALEHYRKAFELDPHRKFAREALRRLQK
jgi:tetratricopeptide (TPR) repeat protein